MRTVVVQNEEADFHDLGAGELSLKPSEQIVADLRGVRAEQLGELEGQLLAVGEIRVLVIR